MIAGILTALILTAAPYHPDDAFAVMLKPECYPSGEQAYFGMPVLLWLYPTPPFQVLRIPESGGDAWRYGRIPLGADPGIPFILGPGGDERSPYSALLVDGNRNGDFTDDGAPRLGNVSSRNGKISVYFPELFAGSAGETSRETSIDASARFTYEQDSGELEYGFLYILRRMTGTVVVDGTPVKIILMDADGNGAYGADDLWAVIEGKEGSGIPIRQGVASAFAPVEKSLRVPDGRSWRLESVSPDGTQAALRRSETAPGSSPAAGYTPPRPPPRPEAEIPVSWLSSLEEAAPRAQEEGKPILLLLTAPDCPFSQAYLSHTFRDADVAELLGAFVPVHAPPGENDEIAAKYEVSGFPFVLILDGELLPKKRIPGYRAAGSLVKVLKTVIP